MAEAYGGSFPWRRVPASVTPPSTEVLDSRAAILAIMLLAFSGVVSQGLAPFIVSGLSQTAGLSASQAGLCISAEMAGSAAGTAIVLFALGIVRRRPLAITALTTIAVGNLLCVYIHSFGEFIAARALAGLGAGLSTAAFGLLASTRMPEQKFAIFSGSVVILISLLGLAVPSLVGLGGVRAVFVLIAAIAITALSVTGLIPQGIGASSQGRTAGAVVILRTSSLIALAMTLSFFAAIAGLWTYIGELGARAGILPTSVSRIVAVSFLFGGALGSLGATLLAPRVKRSTVASMCLVGAAVAANLLASLPGEYVYAAAVALFLLCWFLCYPFLMGLLADLDRSGRLTVFGVLVQAVGWSLGPAIAAQLMVRHAFIGLGLWGSAGFALALLCMRVSARELEKR